MTKKTRTPTLAQVMYHLETAPVRFIRQTLKARGVTAPELRNRSGLPASTCRAFLNGSRDNPTSEQFRVLLTVALDAAGVRR